MSYRTLKTSTVFEDIVLIGKWYLSIMSIIKHPVDHRGDQYWFNTQRDIEADLDVLSWGVRVTLNTPLNNVLEKPEAGL